MTSHYLTEEAAEKREAKLIARLVSELVDLGPAGKTWLPGSDAWKLPESVRRRVQALR